MRSLQEIGTEDLLTEISERLKHVETPPDWVDGYRAGEVLRTDQAACIAAVSDETIRRRCHEADNTGRPIGILIAKAVWLVSRKRLLADIERRGGRHARLAAESRAEKLFKTRLPPQLGARSVAMATMLEADSA
jgi:hypothetical protein